MPVVISKRAQELAAKFCPEEMHNHEILRDVECGLHSGIPECCILFFVRVWSGMSRWHREAYWWTEEDMGVERPGRILCPACVVERRMVELKECDCHRQRTIKLARD